MIELLGFLLLGGGLVTYLTALFGDTAKSSFVKIAGLIVAVMGILILRFTGVEILTK